MSTTTLLGCPHCARPISFVNELAGRLVACPHCHLQLQMPASAPAPPPPKWPPFSAPGPAEQPATDPNETPIRFSFPDLPPAPPAPPRKAEPSTTEPVWYTRTETLATAWAWVGIAGSAVVALLIFQSAVLPAFRAGEADARLTLTGVFATVALLLGLAAAVLGCLLTRAALCVLVDTARHLRSAEAAHKARR